MEAVPGLLQFLDFIMHRNNSTYWNQVSQLLHDPKIWGRWLWFFIHRQRNPTPYTVVQLFSSGGPTGAAIWNSDSEGPAPAWSIKVPLVSSSGRMKDNGHHPLLYYHTSVPVLSQHCSANLTVLHFSKWHSGSQAWIPECLPVKCIAMRYRLCFSATKENE